METKNKITSPLRWDKKLKENGSISVEFIYINKDIFIKMNLTSSNYENYLEFVFTQKKDIATFLELLSVAHKITGKLDGIADMIEVGKSMTTLYNTLCIGHKIQDLHLDENLMFKIAATITKHGQKMWKLLCKSNLLIVLE